MNKNKKKNSESQLKRQKSCKEQRDKREIAKQNLVNEIQKESREQLLPVLKQKTTELTNYIVDLLSLKGKEKVSNIQILSLIAKKSMLEIANAGNQPLYTPQEIAIGFNSYLEMINKINEIKTFPPTIESFSLFMGISRSCYNNYLVDPDKREIMEYIHSYLLGTLASGGLTGELREITSMFISKTMGKVEQTNPVIVKHEVEVDVDSIQSQLQALKRDKIITEADYEEKDE